MSDNNRGHLLALTNQEVALLWQLLNQVNIPGQVAEVFVGLKSQVRQAIEKVPVATGPPTPPEKP